MGVWGGRRKRQDIYVYTELILIAAQQKLTQFIKQLSSKNKKRLHARSVLVGPN